MKRLLSLFISLLFLLTSCLNQERTIASTPTLVTMEITQLSTFSRSPTSTYSQIPFTPTFRETLTPTLIQLPTLDYPGMQKKIWDLIQKPEDCNLPCWWGFTPGVSSWQDVRNFMYHLGYGEIQSLYSYDLNESFPLANDDINLTMLMRKSHEVVSQIQFSSSEYPETDQFRLLWSLYSPQKILFQYDKPSGIYITIMIANAENPIKKIGEGYILWFVYNSLGFMIRYDGLAKVQNGNIHICPHLGQEDIARIDLYLQEPVEPNSYGMEYTFNDFWGIRDFTLSLNEATGLSIDQFMGLGRGEISCFDTPYSVW